MLIEAFKQVPDFRDRKGQTYRLWSLLALVLVGFLCGRRGLRAPRGSKMKTATLPVGLCACGAKGAGPHRLTRQGYGNSRCFGAVGAHRSDRQVVTGDAMFCQKSITEKIVERGGDYVLPVKGNQKKPSRRYPNGVRNAGFPPHA